MRTALLAVFAFVVVDISAGGWKQLNFVSTLTQSHLMGHALRAIGILGVLALLYIVLWHMRAHVAKILAAVFAVMLVTTILITPPPLGRDASTSALKVREAVGFAEREHLPIWVHFIFDEMAAPEAIDADFKNGEELYRRTRNFFSEHDFRVYGQAYSRFRSTFRALSSLVNFDATTVEPLPKYTEGGETPKFMHTNAYFREAANAGYEVRVFQTRHFNFCTVPHVTKCETLNSYSPVSRFVLQQESNLASRTLNLAVILSSAFGESGTSHVLGTLAGKAVGYGAWFDSDAFPAWFDHVAEEIREAPRGTVIFAHFLVPHAPYSLGPDCSSKERIPMHYRTNKAPRDAASWPAFRARYMERYYEQSLCVYTKLDELMQTLDASGRFRDAVFVIHSDHGSRIARAEYAEYMSERDLVDNYATLFAIKKRGVRPGYDLELASVQDIFARYAPRNSSVQEDLTPVSDVTVAERGEKPGIIVVRSAASDALQEVPMPSFAGN